MLIPITFRILWADFRPKVGKKHGTSPRNRSFFLVSNIQIIDGNLEFEDQPARTKHEVIQINLSIPFISNFPSYVEAFVQPSFSALVNGTPLNIKGATKIFSDSRETSFDIALKDIDIPYYLAYAPTNLNVKVPSGRLDVALKAVYRQYTNRSPLLVLTGETKVSNLQIVIKKIQGDFLKIPLFVYRTSPLIWTHVKSRSALSLPRRGCWSFHGLQTGK